MTQPAKVPEGLDETVARFERPLTLYVYRLIGDVERARDVVQEAFARLCIEEKAGRLNGQAMPWLYAVCRNAAIDIQRKERRMRLMTDLADDERVIEHRGGADDPAARIERDETSDRILQVLARLPQNQQEVLRLKFQHGLSYRQIAEVTQLSESNVGFLIHTGLKALRERLA